MVKVWLLSAWCEWFVPQALEINSYKIKILAYVESRMSLVAPNLSRIVGPTVAAKLMG